MQTFSQDLISIEEARVLEQGTTVTVTGWATVTDHYAGPIYLQDETAGIAVYSGPLMRNDGFLLDMQLGDSLVVSGPLSEFNGLLQISGNDVTVEIYPEGNRDIEPEVITVSELNSENYEGQLVTIENVAIDHRGFFQVNTSYAFNDATGTGEIRVQRYNAEFDGAYVPTEEPIIISSVVGQFRGTQQLQPRFPADFGVDDITYPGDNLDTDLTFDVVTWNIEWFGNEENAPGDIEDQFEYVKTIVETIDADVYALQEISSEAQFTRLINELDDYDGMIADYTQTQRTAYLYKTSVISTSDIRVLEEGFTTYYWAGRRPFKLHANLRSGEQVYIYNIHAKSAAGPDPDVSYQRRKNASEEMKTYLDNNRQGDMIIFLGDYNDDIPESTFESATSPYQNFVDDENYSVVTTGLSEAGFFSFGVGRFRSMIDHITISEPLFDLHIDGAERVLVPTYVPEYLRITSDHFPVYTRFDMTGQYTSAEVFTAIPDKFELKGNYPNPFNPTTQIRFTLPAQQNITLSVYDVTGRLVAQPLNNQSMNSGTHNITFDASTLSSGLYIYTLRSSNGNSLSGKMMLIK